ncbi:Uridylate kinase [Coniochaeta hoffmannii]|uniref:Uridylate kinase n=1 Tax=Coniochaeta hoffmannii TaxID=91930 RepID=A0AA38VSV0_9PEZI|nr:Uridylate kinase [Coniochaeta hoffmannii]
MHPMAGAIDGMLWRQLVRRPQAVSLATSSPKRCQSTISSSLLLRRLQSTASPKTTTTSSFFYRTSSFRPRTSHSFRRPYSSQPPPKKGSPAPVKFWPFFLVVALSSGAYIALVNQRAEMAPAIDAPKTAGSLPSPSKPTPTFSPSQATVVFVLGGPGAGKGTQCANLVRDYGFTHLSAGDLLRAEQDRPGSQFGGLIRDCIRDGEIVPMEVTVQLLENAMTEVIRPSSSSSSPSSAPGGGEEKKPKKFLIDGFPRKMDQAIKFEETVCPAKFVLFYDCPEEEMEKRLLERGKTSGREDDNTESIKKRFRTFVETSMPVVDYYEKQGRVVKIDATPSPEKVYEETRRRLGEKLGEGLEK